MYPWLDEGNLQFPPLDQIHESGILAIGGDLSVERLKLAYQMGVFPWYNANEPIVWWNPNPRMVLFPKELKVSKSMRKILKSNSFQITYNQHFQSVIQACARINRPGQDGTWIHPQMISAYIQLHQLGWAKSVEVWQNGQLVGGFYGIDLGDVFCGESMFAKVANASKYAFIYFVQYIFTGKIIDCQVYTKHLASLGAKEIPREQYMRYLSESKKSK